MRSVSTLLSLLLLAACSQAPVSPGQVLSAQSNPPPGAAPPAVPQNPLQIRYHRYVYNLMRPPGGPADPGTVTAARLPWERKLLDPVALVAAASSEHLLNLLHEEPVLAARGMRIALSGEEPVTMDVGDTPAGDAIVSRLPSGIQLTRPGIGTESVKMNDPYMTYDAPGSDRDLRLEYSEERVKLSGRTGGYEAYREGDATVVKTPRGRMTLTPKPDGLSIYENIENGLLGGKTTTISEAGNVLRFERPGTHDDLTVTSSPNSVAVTSPNILHPFTLTRTGNRIEVKYPTNTWRSFSVTISPDKIEIDRWLWGEDVTISRKGNQVKIDRFMFQNDATITREGDKLERQHWSAKLNAWLKGVQAPDYILEEGGLTFHVSPTGIKPLALSLDHGLDVLF